MAHLFKTLIKKDFTVFDIGANIGCTSILFGELSAKVVSFEPVLRTFDFLNKNISAAGLKNILTHNYALGSASGESEITFSPFNRGGAFVSNRINYEVSDGGVTEKIKIEPLDEMFKNLGVPRIDFIKIDVEGFEKEVITGSSATINKFKPIIVLELNHWCLNAFQRLSVPDFFDFLQSTFPVLFAIEGMSYANLHDESDIYEVLSNHILNFKYSNIIAAFDNNQLGTFFDIFHHYSKSRPDSRAHRILKHMYKTLRDFFRYFPK